MNLTDLSKIDLSTKNNEIMMFSNVYQVMKGGFDVEGIETYLSSVKVGFLIKDIEVFEKLTEDKSWPVSSIIQREIDDRRVKQISEEYILNSSNNVKYFPPIIVAIVPRELNENISKSFTLQKNEDKSLNEVVYEKGSFNETVKEMFINAKNISRIDGFCVLDWLGADEKFSLALGWDKSKNYGIVIDGQHRLEALKYSANIKQDINNHMQDIVFLDISKKAHAEKRSPAEAIRRIFIDINYNAKPVSNARRTLMDDKDLSSLIVQSLVNDDDMSGEREGKFLAPQIVDWHSENLKHSFPQITGVLVLQQLIEDNFLEGSNITSLSDMRSRNKVTKFVKILNGRFLVDEKISSKTKYDGINKLESSHLIFKSQIDQQSSDGSDEENKEDILFTMDYNVLSVARDTFEEIYSKNIVKFFNKFSPYKKALDILGKNNVFNPEYNLNRLIIKQSLKLTSDQKIELEKLKTEMVSELDPEFHLTFTVLGQKAFFRHYYKELSKNLQDVTVNELEVSKFTDIWLSKMNHIIETLMGTGFFSAEQKFVTPKDIQNKFKIENSGVIGSSFWQGIIYNEDSIIYNKQGIDGFVGVLSYLYQVTSNIELLNNDDVNLDLWDKIPYSKTRISKKIKRDYPEKDDEDLKVIIDSIWKAKLETVKQLVKTKFNS